MTDPTALTPASDAFPAHVFDALGLPPRVHEERIGGSVMVVSKHLPEGTVLVMTAGVARLPVSSGLPVELAVEVTRGQEGAALVALRIVCDDVAARRQPPPLGTPWRNSEPFLSGTAISAIVATGSRWGAELDDVRDAAGAVGGHVRTLRLLTDGEAAYAHEHGWDALVIEAGSEAALLDVTRTGVVGDGGDAGGPAQPSAAASPTPRSGPPRNRSVVIRSRLHEQHPPRWVTLEDGVFQSVTGLESPEYMSDSGNHEFVAVETFLRAFPWTAEFVRVAREGQTGFFTDASGSFTIED